MSEDVSATMRVGITVILVAALVATVLNLMVMSNSLLSNGQTTLQSGIDSVSTQEFATYDNTKVSGTQVATALSLFQGRDVAIVIQTTSLQQTTGGTNLAVNYGALLTKDGASSSTTNSLVALISGNSATATNGSSALEGVLITSQAKTAYLVKWVDGTQTAAKESLYREAGSANYTSYLHNTNGLVDSSYDIIGTTELGNAAYLLSSGRFSSVLIKDPTGSIIGIFFRQLS
jgi:hypothetical protein